MSKSKWSAEFRAKVSQEYLDGIGSTYFLADKYKIGKTTLRKWIAAYKVHGIDAFSPQKGNASYTSEFKIQSVEEVISGQGSILDIAAKYKIYPSVLERWIKAYNTHIELKDYNLEQEVYMAEARRKTTLSERKEIVKYCLEHNRNYKETAALYAVSYSQVYSWVKKYNTTGEDGLTDKRGHRKNDDEVDELERLKRENLHLKRQLEERDKVVELLKKVKEFERM